MKRRKRLKQYSEFLISVAKAERGMLKSESHFLDSLRYGIKNAAIKDYSIDHRKRVSLEALFAWQWKFKTLDHYFLAPGVLQACTRFLKDDLSEYFDVPFVVDGDIGNDGVLPPPNPISIIGKSDSEAPKCFFLHFPLSERRDSIMVTAPLTNTNGERVFFARCGGYREPQKVYVYTRGASAPTDYGWLETLRAVLGFQLYANAFPETITRNGNLGIMDLHKYQGGKRYVKASKITSSEIESARSPHWRRGHFRLLSSDRYKHKQGKTVFVKGCFVRGTAHSVTSTAQQQSNSEPQQP